MHQKQQKTMNEKQFTIFGGTHREGSYLLLIQLSRTIELAFGKFQQGKRFILPAGDYLYIGSALGGTSSGSPLARRLMRHASRSAEQPHHAIRAEMIELFSMSGLIEKESIKPSAKKLRWHIDYLLDQPEAELIHVIIIQSPLRVEAMLARLIATMDETSIIAPRLGAQDTKSSTHLLALANRERLFELLQCHIPAMLKL